MATKQFENYADLITFTRASTATYLDSDGLLKSATTNTPRIEYDADGNRLGLLIEEARTNLVTQSEVSTANWPVVSVTTEQLSGNYLGVFNGVRVSSTGATWNRIRSPATISVVSGTAYTLTVWFVTGTSGRARIVLRDNTNSTETRVIGPVGSLGTNSEVFGPLTNLTQQTVGSIQKVSFTVTVNATVSNASVEIGPETSNVGQDIILLAAQLEAGSFPTSYIPTAGATATRAADVASIPTSAFGYNQKAGTVVCEASTYRTPDNDTYLWQIDSGFGADRYTARLSVSSLYGAFVIIDTVTAANLSAGSALSAGDTIKFGYAFADGDQYTYSAGFSDTDTAGLPANRTTLRLGSDVGTSRQLSGHLKSIQFYPRRLTNAQLQELTA
jgi:hypothetical protein